MVRLNYRGRVIFHNGDTELAPGLRVHLAGGHSAGLQFVSVHTQRGWLVLASDVTHYYEHMDSGRPFTTTFNVGDTLEGYERLRALAPSPDHIVPVMTHSSCRFIPPAMPELKDIAVRLDVPPSKRLR